jgi:glycosyltransferase involved in cell wall biosynthesis
LRITFLQHGFAATGGMRVVAQLGHQLQKRGHEVLVVGSRERTIPTRSRIKSLIRGGGWSPPNRFNPVFFDRLGVPYKVSQYQADIRDDDVPDADVVVATFWISAEWAARLSPSKGARAYFLQHYEATFEGAPADRVDATWRLPLHKITIARWLVDLARDRFGDRDVSIIPIAFDHSLFHAEPRGKQPTPTVGLIYYPNAPQKGCDVALRAIERVAQRFPNLKVKAFGHHPPGENGLPLPPYATFTENPPQDQIHTIYGGCDAWVCGSRSEGFIIPPLEAMACRTPVVSTRVSGPDTYIEDGVNSYLVDIDDEMALAERLEMLLRLPDPDWRRLSDAAHATAQTYTWERSVEAFEAGLNRAIERSQIPADQPGSLAPA